MNKALFLDKDGTIVDSSSLPYRIPKDTLLETKVLDGLRHAQDKGYLLILISNQGWIAMNRATYDEIDRVFKSTAQKLQKHDIIITDYFFCPHKAKDGCICRKPKPQMILEAAKKYNIDLTQSFMVGDSQSDIDAGKGAGCTTILVRTGRGKKYEKETNADSVVDDVNAIDFI